MLSFYPISDIIVGMGCGGVNVEYIVRDTQGVDETSLAQILASNQLAHTVQSSLQDEGYPADVTPAEAVTVVIAPTPAPTLAPVTINCNRCVRRDAVSLCCWMLLQSFDPLFSLLSFRLTHPVNLLH